MVRFSPLIVLALAVGCVEHGAHSLEVAPLVVPGLNSAVDGWRPRIKSGDAYHSWKPGPKPKPPRTPRWTWMCGATCKCDRGNGMFRTGSWNQVLTHELDVAQGDAAARALGKCLSMSGRAIAKPTITDCYQRELP